MTESRKFMPGAYRLNRCELINQEGERIDILNLIDSFTVTESIYSLFAQYEFMIVDGVVLLEKFGIVGNEKIELEIQKRDNPDDDDTVIEKHLAVIGLSNYVKAVNNIQTYKIKCICEEALLSSVVRISRGVSGNPVQIISDLYNEISSELPLTIIDAGAEGNFKGVIPNTTLVDTISYLLGAAQSSSAISYYFYETLWNDLELSSYSEMINREVVDTYYMNNITSAAPGDYDIMRKKIRDITSNFGISNFESFSHGGFTSRTHSVDVATKTYNIIDFNLANSNLPKIDKEHRIDPNYTLAGKTLDDMEEAKYYLVKKNTLAFNGAEINFNDKQDLTISKKAAIYENQFAFSHKMRLAGDTRLKSGNMIEVSVPPASDPAAASEERRDDMLSGNYLITSVIHNFESNEAYTVDLALKRDSTDRQKMMVKYRNQENDK